MNPLPTYSLETQDREQGPVSRHRPHWRQYWAALLLFAALLSTTLVTNPVLAADEVVNINLASPEVLSEQLTGIGLAKANRIVEHREMYGPFESVDELSEVRGIGAATVERNRERIVLN